MWLFLRGLISNLGKNIPLVGVFCTSESCISRRCHRIPQIISALIRVNLREIFFFVSQRCFFYLIIAAFLALIFLSPLMFNLKNIRTSGRCFPLPANMVFRFTFYYLHFAPLRLCETHKFPLVGFVPYQ